MNNLCDLFHQISMTNSTKEKKNLLISFENPLLLRSVLKLVYDPDYLFRITSKVAQEKVVASYGTTDDFTAQELVRVMQMNGTLNKIKLLGELKSMLTQRAYNWLLKCIDKDLAIGIKKKLINDVFPGLVKDFPVMLAARRDKEAFLRTFGGLDFVYLNLKIDGIRCVADNTGIEPKFYTREGHLIPDFLVENIKPEVSKLPSMLFDGEIYCDNFQKLMTVFRRESIDADSIIVRDSCKLAIFDVLVYDHKLFQRVEILDKVQETKYVKKVKYVKVPVNYEEICKIAQKYIDRGDEGIIVKHPQSLYEAKRSNNWMKFKNKETEDCKIVSFFEGEGKYAGLLGGFVVDFNGKELRVGSGYTDEERTEMWKNKSGYIGKTMEISFMEKTKDELARHPVFERMRLDKENPKQGVEA